MKDVQTHLINCVREALSPNQAHTQESKSIKVGNCSINENGEKITSVTMKQTVPAGIDCTSVLDIY